MHLNAVDFGDITGERTRDLSNGDYVMAILERGQDGVIVVHTLHPNVRDREVFNYCESNEMMK